MTAMKKVLAFDFGASSGRAMIGGFDGEKITLNEIHRFTNDSVNLNGTLFWDTPHQLHEIENGIQKCKLDGGASSIGIDTWGVDFGLIDKQGFLIGNEIHYRDANVNTMFPEAVKIVSKSEIYKKTGIQFLSFNTLFQLFYLVKHRPEMLQAADKMLMTPDLFNYFLTGEKNSEYTIASTSQLLDIGKKDWSRKLAGDFGIPDRIFSDIIAPGSKAGMLSGSVCERLGAKQVPVVAVASHDTASAVAAVPALSDNFAYLSSGTWSLLGTELDEPVVSEKSLQCNFTNEGGYGGKIRYLKNIVGLFLIQETQKQWKREGKDFTFADLEAQGRESKPFRCFIDPDAPALSVPGNIPKHIREFCEATGQYVPQSRGEIMRCIYESLAMKYKYTLSELSKTAGRSFSALHIIGGGTKDKFLSELTADACGIPVYSGPAEATVIGNIAVQLIALGEIKSLKQAREIIAASFKQARYEPQNTGAWDDAYEEFKKINGREGDNN